MIPKVIGDHGNGILYRLLADGSQDQARHVARQESDAKVQERARCRPARPELIEQAAQALDRRAPCRYRRLGLWRELQQMQQGLPIRRIAMQLPVHIDPDYSVAVLVMSDER